MISLPLSLYEIMSLSLGTHPRCCTVVPWSDSEGVNPLLGGSEGGGGAGGGGAGGGDGGTSGGLMGGSEGAIGGGGGGGANVGHGGGGGGLLPVANAGGASYGGANGGEAGGWREALPLRLPPAQVCSSLSCGLGPKAPVGPFPKVPFWPLAGARLNPVSLRLPLFLFRTT